MNRICITRLAFCNTPLHSQPFTRVCPGRRTYVSNARKGHRLNSNPVVSGIKAYAKLLEKYPLPASGFSSAVIASSSDLVAQYFSPRSEEFQWDRRRTLSMAVLACCINTPLLHHFYAFLDRVRPVVNTSSLLFQLAIDQLVMAPAIVFVYFAYVGAWSRRSISEIREQMARDFLPTMLMTWSLYPFTQLISFRFLPTYMRIVCLNVVDFVWNAYVSLWSHTPVEGEIPMNEKSK
eukprot:Rmarinus@m.5504